MSKYDKLLLASKNSEVVKKIPLDDVDAYKHYPKHRWIYNRLALVEFQKIPCAPMPIEPNERDFPIIIKPIINLYGMGLDIAKIDNLSEFYDEWFNSHFWMKYYDGEHISWDLIVQNGQILFHTAFLGHKNHKHLGVFDCWESINKPLPKIIHKLVDNLPGYCGCLNVETIANVIIEAHLRMGDIDVFPKLDFMKGIVNVYQSKSDYNWSDLQLGQVYFYPIWCKLSNYRKRRKILEKKIKPLMKKYKIKVFELDETCLACPKHFKRLMWFVCSKPKKGKKICKKIYKIFQ